MIKRSFFERLTGASSDTFDSFDDVSSAIPATRDDSSNRPDKSLSHPETPDDTSSVHEGQLPVDVYQTTGDIVIHAFVAGVRPDELSISISRDMVEIGGSRAERSQVSAPDYFTRELFWGSFSRTVVLPQEIDVDAATATAKDGLLTLTLPKLDRTRQTKLRVKAG